MRRAAAWVATAVLLLPALALAPPGAASAAWQPGRNDYTVEMRDGTLIDATMWVPAGAEPGDLLPAVVAIHGYGGSKDTKAARLAAEHGYVGFAYSTRGFGQSTGQMDVVGPASMGDLKELVAWLKANGPVHPAKVGVVGASYGGAHALQIATMPDAGVATVVPIATWSDLVLGLTPNHVTKFSYATGFYAGGNGLVQSGCQPMCLEVAGIDLGRRQLYDTYAPEVHLGYASLVTGVGSGATEQFLRERSAALSVERIHVPIFLIQGLNDDLFAGDQVVPFFERIPAAEKRLHLGFVGHPRGTTGGPEVAYLMGEVYRWFDHYLKGEGPRPFDPARPIEVARQPWDGSVLRLASWPGGGLGTAYALNADGTLGAPGSPGLGAFANTLAAGVPDDPVVPLFVPETGDVPAGTPADTLVFRSGVLEGPVELLGTPRAELKLVSTGASHQVAVKVFDLDDATGEATLVTRGIYGVPDNLPGASQRLLFDLQPYRHTFAAGHRIEVRLAASDFPTYLPEKGPFATLVELGAGGSVLRLPLSAPLP